jgi:hypothetical protein
MRSGSSVTDPETTTTTYVTAVIDARHPPFPLPRLLDRTSTTSEGSYTSRTLSQCRWRSEPRPGQHRHGCASRGDCSMARGALRPPGAHGSNNGVPPAECGDLVRLARAAQIEGGRPN